MDGRRFPAYLFSGARRGLSTWWSEKLFAGCIEKPSKQGFLTSFFPPILLTLVAGLLFFSRLGCTLLEPEEARYAEIPRAMLAEGRWLMPLLHGEDYLQKPPVLYWLIMVCYQIFGVYDWAARLVPSSAGVLIVLVTYAWALRTVGPRTALASGVILCLSARFLYLGGMVAMDSLLCLWVIAALACGHMALGFQKEQGGRTREENERDTSFFILHSSSIRPVWWLLSALCCGLGIMTKGPVAAVLIVGPLATWTFLERRCPRVSVGWWFLYLGALLLVAGPWYVAISMRDPEAAGTFFWLHNVVRYLAPFDHDKPAWFYVPSLVIGMLPWTLLLVPLVAYLARRSPRWAARRPAGLGFFLLTFLWCLAFFSLSGCKRVGYILPAFPTLALLLGTYMTRAFPRNYWNQPVWTLGTGMMALALFVASHTMLPDYHRKFGLRGQTRRHGDLARNMAVVCYPKHWDSVSFYLGREVTCFGPGERDQLLTHLQNVDTLLFVKNDVFLGDVLGALPQGMEFVPCGRQGRNVKVGVVKRKVQ